MIEIKEGRYYLNGRGATVGSMRRSPMPRYQWTDGRYDYSIHGELFIGVKGKDNLVEEATP